MRATRLRAHVRCFHHRFDHAAVPPEARHAGMIGRSGGGLEAATLPGFARPGASRRFSWSGGQAPAGTSASTVTGIPLSTALPDSGSTNAPSARRFEFTPA